MRKQKLIGIAFIVLAGLICIVGAGEPGGGTGAILMGVIGLMLIISKKRWIE